MSAGYRRVMGGSAVAGGLTATGYTIASIMAVADGTDAGVEVPRPINTWCVIVIVCSTLIAGGAWLIRRGHRDATERDLRPMVREELDRALAEQMPLFVATVVEGLDRRMGERMHEVAVAAGKQTVARVRDAVTADLTEIARDIHRKATITGALMQQASAAGQPVQGTPRLRPVRQYVSTSEGD